MTKIDLSSLDGPYRAEIDAEAMDVTIRHCYNGVEFVTIDGERLGVRMRDGGYEVHYWRDPVDHPGDDFDAGWTTFNNGEVRGRLKGDRAAADADEQLRFALKQMDRRPHSRACGLVNHPHGKSCSHDCPTCHGRDEEA